MDSLQSWLDAKAVRQMAESLMAPTPEVDESAIDAGYGERFEGFAGNAPGAAAPVHPVRGHGEAQPGHKQFFSRSAVSLETVEVKPPVNEQVAPVQVPHPVEDSQRAVAGSSLADAKRLAEHSGMLSTDESGEPDVVQENPDDLVAGSEPSGFDNESPFKISADQIHRHDDPEASRSSAQVDEPDVDSGPRTIQPDEIGEAEVSGELRQQEAELPPAQEKAKPFFRPAIHINQNRRVPEPKADTHVPEKTANVAGAPELLAADDSGSAADERISNRPGEHVGMRGPFLTRLQRFSEVIRRELGAKAMFLIDNEGQILLDEVENAKLIQVARTLANASYRASRQTAGAAAVGNLHVKISASATLEVVPVESRYGLLILGVIFPAPIGAARVIQVADELFRTVEPHY